MEELLNKLENYIFDVLGLFLPGAVFLYLISNLFELQTLDARQFSAFFPPKYAPFIFVIASYLLGHTVKVVASKVYSGGSKLFNCFKVEHNYLLESEAMKSMVNKELDKRLDLMQMQLFQTCSWHLTFKFAEVILKNNGIKTVKELFLAKYNLYRSLAFLFVFLLILLIIIRLGVLPTIKLSKIVEVNYFLACIVFILLGWTFHTKFKRYWTLCGNETIVGLYYFINRKKLDP